MSSSGAMRPSASRRANSASKPDATKRSTSWKISPTRGLRVELQADLDAHAAAVGGLLDEIVLAQRLEGFEKIGRLGEGCQPLGEFRAVALGDASDQRLLAVEVDVERAGADRRLLADVVHGGAVEAGVGKAALGRLEDVLSSRALDVWLELGHGCPVGLARALPIPMCWHASRVSSAPPELAHPSTRQPNCSAPKKTNIRFICKKGGQVKATDRKARWIHFTTV